MKKKNRSKKKLKKKVKVTMILLFVIAVFVGMGLFFVTNRPLTKDNIGIHNYCSSKDVKGSNYNDSL